MTDVADAPTRRVTLDELRSHRQEIEAIGARYGVRRVRVFGSVARGEADEASDVDLLVDLDEGRGLFALAGFEMDVEAEVGVRTDAATVASLKPRIRDRVLREAVPL